MTYNVFGTIQGTTIHLDRDLGLPEGQRVEVVVRATASSTKGVEGLLRAAGAMSEIWTPEDDEILEEIYRDRKNDRRPEIEP